MGFRKNKKRINEKEIIDIYFYYFNLAKEINKISPMFAKKYIEIILKIKRKTHIELPTEIKENICENCLNLKNACVCSLWE